MAGPLPRILQITFYIMFMFSSGVHFRLLNWISDESMLIFQNFPTPSVHFQIATCTSQDLFPICCGDSACIWKLAAAVSNIVGVFWIENSESNCLNFMVFMSHVECRGWLLISKNMKTVYVLQKGNAEHVMTTLKYVHVWVVPCVCMLVV